MFALAALLGRITISGWNRIFPVSFGITSIPPGFNLSFDGLAPFSFKKEDGTFYFSIENLVLWARSEQDGSVLDLCV